MSEKETREVPQEVLDLCYAALTMALTCQIDQVTEATVDEAHTALVDFVDV